MKTYRSHKTVEAGEITTVERFDDAYVVELTLDYDDTQKARVSAEWVMKHKPGHDISSLLRGYFVRYADGYTSWSPAEAFEAGYTLVEPEPEPTNVMQLRPGIVGNGVTLDPDAILEANKGDLQQLVIIGWSRDANISEPVVASTTSAHETLWLIEQGKLHLLTMP